VRSTPPTRFLSGTKEPVVIALFIKLKNTSELGCRQCGRRSRYSLADALEFLPVDYHHFGVLINVTFLSVRGDQEGLFKLVVQNFIFKWYSWSNFRLSTV
jgi:hypothetical protein